MTTKDKLTFHPSQTVPAILNRGPYYQTAWERVRSKLKNRNIYILWHSGSDRRYCTLFIHHRHRSSTGLLRKTSLQENLSTTTFSSV